MKNLLLCAGLMAATAGGVAFVMANRPVPVEAGVKTPDPAPAASDSACPNCQGGVYDVTDLTAKFATKTEGSGEFISFDEPPLAKQKPTEPREVLPAPREVKD